jgi:hypothetical protein
MRALFLSDFISCERSLEFVACSPILKNCGEREQDASCRTVRAEEYKRKQGLDWSWVGTPKLSDASTDHGPASLQRSSGVAWPCMDRSLLFALRSGWLAIRWCFLLFAVRRSGFALFFYDFSLRLALLLYSYYSWSIYHAPNLQ